MICPVCHRSIYSLEKWRGIYICTPCRKKFEKIETFIKEGQLLEGPSLDSVLSFFGDKEEEVIKVSSSVRMKRRKKPKVPKPVINIKAPKRRKRRNDSNNK